MTAMTDYLETALLNHVLRNQVWTPPTTVYIGLYTSPTADDGSGTEATGGSYARQPITFGAPALDGTSMAARNLDPVVFSNMPEVTVTHLALLSAVTGGNMLLHGALTANRTTVLGDNLVLTANDLAVLLG